MVQVSNFFFAIKSFETVPKKAHWSRKLHMMKVLIKVQGTERVTKDQTLVLQIS